MHGSVGGSRMDLADEEEKVEERGDVGSSFKSDHNFGKDSQEREEVKYSAFANSQTPQQKQNPKLSLTGHTLDEDSRFR
jgi:hypothetical protein